MIDVAIVGAGAAGLAAANALHASGYRVQVLEARDRLGGRVFTRRDARLPIPIELGAEFLHGEAKRTRELLREATQAMVDLRGEHWHAERGKLRPADEWERIRRVLKRIHRKQKDMPFSEFLKRRVSGNGMIADRRAAARFVQGFHAADLDVVSTQSVAPNELESVLRLARVVSGYDTIINWLARDLDDMIRLSAEVLDLEWEKGRVKLTVRNSDTTLDRIQARAAVVTVPIGVLDAARRGEPGIRIEPFPATTAKALDGLAMGLVTRIVIWFTEFPWSSPSHFPKKADPSGLGFLHLPEGPMNVWWTAFPMDVSLAVAWSGGPPAAEHAGRSASEVERVAFSSLAAHLGVSRRYITSRVRDTWRHDWTTDPYTRGAYSYVRVNGTGSADALAKPIESTLFFSGEATHAGSSGTVEGAIQSGERAAAQVKRALHG